MSSDHYGHTATLLPDGGVLVAAGAPSTFQGKARIYYHPPANDWDVAANLNTIRYGHSATLLPDGRVLVTGGINLNLAIAGAEIYDPAQNAWTPVAPLNTARFSHTATLLQDGRVLVTGGYSLNLGIAVVEIYDPAVNRWDSSNDLNSARGGHTATLLPDGRVLVTGGGSLAHAIPGAEICDKYYHTWTTVASLFTARSHHTATLLPSGRVLVVGGYNDSGSLASTEIFNSGLGYNFLWRPKVTQIPPTLMLGNALTLNGSGFRGYGFSEGSGGGTNNSAGNYPIIQVFRLDNEQITWLKPGGAFSPTAFTSQPVNGILPGPALVTVFVNGIPSVSKYILIKFGCHLFLPSILN
jgi:hypothetical protein